MVRILIRSLLILIVSGLGVLWLFGERWRLLRRSTFASIKASGPENALNGLHGYIYGRWTNQYLKVFSDWIYPRLDEAGKKWWRDRYHGKVLTHEHARSIIQLDHDIDLRNLEQVIPYPMARDLVLHGPPEVAAYECGCRHRHANHCEPTQVCMVIGEGGVNFELEHNPQSVRRLTQAEALELLEAEHERGHVHSAWFKDAMMGRFYAICNCCKCCCGGIEAMMKYGSPVLASSGFVAQVDEMACKGCATCAQVCPFEAISVNGHSQVAWEKCMGCGVCESQCPNDAISLVRDERKGIPMDLRVLGAVEQPVAI